MWQGRYGLPLAVGFVVIAGLVLDRSRRRPSRGPAPGRCRGARQPAPQPAWSRSCTPSWPGRCPPPTAPGCSAAAWLLIAAPLVAWLILAAADLAAPSRRSERARHDRARHGLGADARPRGRARRRRPGHAGQPRPPDPARRRGRHRRGRPADRPRTTRCSSDYAASRAGVVRVRLATNQGAGVANGAGLAGRDRHLDREGGRRRHAAAAPVRDPARRARRDRRRPVRRGDVGVRRGPGAADPAAHQPRHPRRHRPANALQQPDQPPDRDVPARARAARAAATRRCGSCRTTTCSRGCWSAAPE